MSDMVWCIATRCWAGWEDCVLSWDETANENYRRVVISNTDVVTAFQHCYQRTDESILMYVHDDVVIYEKGWDSRVLRQFDDPRVGVVGFGGALGHGQPHLYEVPYKLSNLARQNFMSNMRNAEV